MKPIIQFYQHRLFAALILVLLTQSANAQQIEVEGKPNEHGITINNPGWDGIRVTNPGNSGFVVVDANIYGGYFTSSNTSTYPAIFTLHGNEGLDDLFLGGIRGRIGTDGDVLVHLDRNDDSFNHFAVTDGGGTVKMFVNENGDGFVIGNWDKASGSFKIDHPLDPANKYLYHSFVESPDMMNVYNGNVILDAQGEATIEMPDWFEVLNQDFRYQLTPIGAPGPNLYIADEMDGNTFRIAGGTPAIKVSWQVTGIRQDPYANENRIQVEVLKENHNKGKYLHPKEWEKALGVKGLKPVILKENLNVGIET